MFNPLNPRAARDNFLQGAVDILQALRVSAVALSAAASPTGAAIVFDPGALAFFGHSQGSTSGEIALAWSGAAPAAVFSGAGVAPDVVAARQDDAGQHRRRAWRS